MSGGGEASEMCTTHLRRAPHDVAGILEGLLRHIVLFLLEVDGRAEQQDFRIIGSTLLQVLLGGWEVIVLIVGQGLQLVHLLERIETTTSTKARPLFESQGTVKEKNRTVYPSLGFQKRRHPLSSLHSERTGGREHTQRTFSESSGSSMVLQMRMHSEYRLAFSRACAKFSLYWLTSG